MASSVQHAVLHRSEAVHMGWGHGDRNNFQIEVCFAILAWGVAAITSVRSKDGERKLCKHWLLSSEFI